MKNSYVAFTLIFLILTGSFACVTPVKVTAQAQQTNTNLLPQNTNYTIQTSIRYEQDNSSYHLMDAYLPVGNGPYPAIVYIHGGGWTRGSRSNSNDTAIYYAQRGIAGFAVDYTLTIDNNSGWPQNIQDVVSAVRFIKQNAELYRIDASKMAVLGFSAGGHLASLVGTLTGDESFLAGSENPSVSSRVNLVIDYAGPTDLPFIGQNEANLSIYNITKNGLGNVTYTANPALWTQASPTTYISQDDPVFFIAHGTNDTVVPIAISESFNAKLQAAGVQTHFLTLDVNHDALISSTELPVLGNSLEPVLKQVFNIDQPASAEFPTLLVTSLIVTVGALVAVIVTSLWIRKNRAASTKRTLSTSETVIYGGKACFSVDG